MLFCWCSSLLWDVRAPHHIPTWLSDVLSSSVLWCCQHGRWFLTLSLCFLASPVHYVGLLQCSGISNAQITSLCSASYVSWQRDTACICCWMPCRSTAATECQPCSTHTHTCLTALCPGLPRWAGTRKVKPVWILLKQETMSGSGISCAICKSAPRSRQITMPAPHHSVFLQAGYPSCHPTNSVKALKAYAGHSAIDLYLLLWAYSNKPL